MKFVFAAALLGFFSPAAFPQEIQEIQEIQVEVRTEDGAKKAAIAQAAAQASREAVLDFLGQEKYNANLRAVQKHILANHNRFLLYSKSGAGRIQDDGRFLTTVTLGFSKKNLQKLLLEHNLFFASKGSLCILPLVSFAFSPPSGSLSAGPAPGTQQAPLTQAPLSGLLSTAKNRQEPYYFWREAPPIFDRAEESGGGASLKKPGFFSGLAAKAAKPASGLNLFRGEEKAAPSVTEPEAARAAKSARREAKDLSGKEEALLAEKTASERGPKILAEIFHNRLSLSAVKNGLFSPNPSFSRLPSALSVFGFRHLPVALSKKEIARLADFLECRLILSGKIRVSQSAQAQGSSASVLSHYISLKAFHAQTRRVFFKINRKILVPAHFSSASSAAKPGAVAGTDFSGTSGGAAGRGAKNSLAGPFLDDSTLQAFAAVSEKVLSGAVSQLAEEKREGSLDLHALLLAVQGPLAEFEKERLEKALIKHVPAIKSLQKRLLSSARSVYLVKTDANARELKRFIKSASVPGYRIKIVASGKRRIELSVKPLRG